MDSNCKRGLISGFGLEIGDDKISVVDEQEGQGGSDGDGSVGNGEGIGVGGSDGQYSNVVVTVELASGRTFGPWPVDSTKGMVTYVHCGGVLPAKITFEGQAANAAYYDEGLRRDVSFTGKTRVGLLTDYEKNVGITPLTEALYERAMQIGRQRGLAEGWKDLSVIAQAHSELLSVINDQLPSIYRLTDLRRLPVMLNSTNDRASSETLPANQNGIYGADVAGFSLLGSTTLPGSDQPALDVAATLISDLTDGVLDLSDLNDQPLAQRGRVPYTYDTLWSMLTVGAGETAVRNGRDRLELDAVPIGYVRSRAEPGNAGAVTETLYVLGSNGIVIASLNPSVNGGEPTKPAGDRRFSQLYRFGLEPVVALRRDGQGLLVFPTSWDGSFSFEVTPPSPAVTMVEMFDAGYPVIRMSDGSLFRLEGSVLVPEPAPVDTLSYSCRDEYEGALASPADAELGLANGRLCYGLNVFNELRVWRPSSVVSGRLIDLGRIQQVHSNEQITLALLSDGTLFQLDTDHSVQFRDAGGNLVDQLVGGETRELITPRAAPLQINAPRICWVRAPFVIGCDRTAYQLEYQEYLDPQGRFKGAGPITGLKQLPIPAPVWRPLLNRQITVGDVQLGTDSVFVGVDGQVYDLDGQALTLPLAGAPQQRNDQPPLAPTVSPVAIDDVLDRGEAQSPLLINGIAQPGSTLNVTLGTRQQQTTANGNGRWQVSFPAAELPTDDGPVTLEAVATNPFGSSAPTIRTVNVLRSLPSTPTINAVEGDNTVTADEAADGVTITGSALAGTTVQVSWAGQNKTTNSNGGWSVSFAAGEVPAPSDTQVLASASNVNGVSDTATLAVRVLPALPRTPQIGTVAGDNVISPAEANVGVTISGTGSPGSNVTVNWSGNTKSAPVDGSSNWSAFYSASEIPSPGQSTVTAVASNSAGTSGTASVNVQVERPPIPVPPQPTINTVSGDNRVSPAEASSGVAIAGRASAGVTVRVDWAGRTKSTTADGSGNWSTFFSANEIPQPGSTTVSARAENVSGTSQPASLGVIVESGPVQATIDAIEQDDFVAVSDVSPTNGIEFSGTASPNQALELRWLLARDRSLVVELQTDADNNGRWSTAYPYALTTDDSVLEVKVCDQSTCLSSFRNFSLDTKLLPRIVKVEVINLDAGTSSYVIPNGGSYELQINDGYAQFEVTVATTRGIYFVGHFPPARGNTTTTNFSSRTEGEENINVYRDNSLGGANGLGTFTYTLDANFLNGIRRQVPSTYSVTISRDSCCF